MLRNKSTISSESSVSLDWDILYHARCSLYWVISEEQQASSVPILNHSKRESCAWLGRLKAVIESWSRRSSMPAFWQERAKSAAT